MRRAPARLLLRPWQRPRISDHDPEEIALLWLVHQRSVNDCMIALMVDEKTNPSELANLCNEFGYAIEAMEAGAL